MNCTLISFVFYIYVVYLFFYITLIRTHCLSMATPTPFSVLSHLNGLMFIPRFIVVYFYVCSVSLLNLYVYFFTDFFHPVRDRWMIEGTRFILLWSYFMKEFSPILLYFRFIFTCFLGFPWFITFLGCMT